MNRLQDVLARQPDVVVPLRAGRPVHLREDLERLAPLSLKSVCSLGSERGVQRVRMDFGEREVAIDKTQLVPELLLNGLDNPCRAPGIGAFVVAVLHERDRGRVRPLNVVPLADGNRKMCSLCHGLLSFAGAFWQTYSVRGSQSGSAKSSQSWSA